MIETAAPKGTGMTHMHRAVEAKDIKPGDELMTEYHDVDGMLQHQDDTVTAVKVFARKVRITVEGFDRVLSVPTTQVFGVKEN